MPTRTAEGSLTVPAIGSDSPLGQSSGRGMSPNCFAISTEMRWIPSSVRTSARYWPASHGRNAVSAPAGTRTRSGTPASAGPSIVAALIHSNSLLWWSSHHRTPRIFTAAGAVMARAATSAPPRVMTAVSRGSASCAIAAHHSVYCGAAVGVGPAAPGPWRSTAATPHSSCCVTTLVAAVQWGPGGVPGSVDGGGLGAEVATTAACDASGWGVVGVDSHGFAIAAPMASATTMAPTTAGSNLRRPRSSRSGSNSTVTALWSAREWDDPPLGVERGFATGTSEVGAGDLVASVVARSDERRGFDVLEAECERLDIHLGEFIGVVIALEGEVLECRPQVLTDGQDVHVGRAQRLERLRQLHPRLAESDHQARLRVNGIGDLGGHLLGTTQDVQAAVPPSALADGLLEPLHGLEVVVEDVGTSVHHRPEPVVRPIEVGDEHLDAHLWRRRPHPRDGLRKDARTAVGQVVACDRRHNDVLEPQRPDRLGNATRLVCVEPRGAARLHGTETAGPRARVAEDHDRRGALVPTLPDVRAVGLFADRVQVEAAKE